MLLIELTIVLALLLLGFALPRRGGSMLHASRCWYRRLVRRRALCIALIGLLALAVQVGIGCLVHWPIPALHDEFSYLLAGDTFASGRLTNPVHPLWEHFESYNVIHQPTYQSKYPPGQGLTLALGQVVAGAPIVGVWLTVAAAAAAVTWMAYAWLPARWAPIVGLLLVCNCRLLRFWGHTYMGGGLALLGGALLFGALRRVVARPRALDATLLGLGVVILAYSRPYEGLIASSCAALALGYGLLRKQGPRWTDLVRGFVVPCGAVLLGGGLWMACYHNAVTGSPLKWPYQVWLESYSVDGSLLSVVVRKADDEIPAAEPPRRVGEPPTEGDWREWFSRRKSLGGKLLIHWSFYVGLILTPAMLFIPVSARRDWMLFAVATTSATLTAIFLQNTHGHAHYAAPVGCLIMVLLVQGLRGLQTWTVGRRRVGKTISRLLPASVAAICVLYLLLDWAPRPVSESLAWSVSRDRLLQRLANDDERHVVIVRHASSRETGIYWNEWVYNRARIDAASVVWARDLGPLRNQRLVEYYDDRKLWLLDLERQQLQPYPSAVEVPDVVAAVR